MFLLFVSRHILNAAWRKHLLREGYTPLRIFGKVVDKSLESLCCHC